MRPHLHQCVMEGKVVCKLASKMDKRTNIPVNSGNQVGTPSLHSSQCIRKLDLSVHAIIQTTGLSAPQKVPGLWS